MKKAAEWFYGTIFKDEPIRPRNPQPIERVPSMIRTARSLENSSNNNWQSRESIFLKQAKLLANYEDDYTFNGNVVRYYPTYQALTDQELRGYFSWRTKLRKGDIQKTSLSFAFLYIYELINQVGVENPLDGYYKLKAFQDSYGELDSSILSYLSKWLTDYVVYYNLDPNLLGDSPQVVFDRSITILDMVQDQDEPKIMYALKQLAPKWLARSKFYGANQADCDTVIVRVLRRVSNHYATRTKKTMVEQYFGKLSQYQVRLFDTAVFCNPLKTRSCEYAVDERCIYRCQNGLWTVTKHAGPLRPSSKLEDVLKTIDAVMREEYSYKHPVKYETDTKWLIKIIREETQALLAEKKAAEAKKITIDYSQLARIREEAAVTQEKLTVEDELEEDFPETQTTPECKEDAPAQMQDDPSPALESPLTPAEYRLLQCLLYGQDWSWVQAEGYMLSVLSDSINDKLYEIFLDSVMDDTPALIEDYIDDLKEMVKP
ncbi:MAG: TerB N-terminal domain-containing protein [Bacteroidales bacterium]|nr:TerB N-terminal domain-containing protein [Bacteroidales bacterium]